jgi:dihydroorotate dehydrogenase
MLDGHEPTISNNKKKSKEKYDKYVKEVEEKLLLSDCVEFNVSLTFVPFLIKGKGYEDQVDAKLEVNVTGCSKEINDKLVYIFTYTDADQIFTKAFKKLDVINNRLQKLWVNCLYT